MAEFQALLDGIKDKTVTYNDIKTSHELREHERDELIKLFLFRQATEDVSGVTTPVVEGSGTEADPIPAGALVIEVFPTGGTVLYGGNDISAMEYYRDEAPAGRTLLAPTITGTGAAYTWKSYS